MKLNKKASLLFLIALALYFIISVFLPTDTEKISYGTLLVLNAFAVSIPAFLIPAIVFRRKNGFAVYPAPRVTHILIALMLGIGCMLLNVALVCLDQAITYGMEINSTAVDVKQGLEGASMPLMILTIAVIPAICEEFMMRGALLETWRRTSFIGAAVITSLLFALLHASPSNLIVYFAMGMLFAVVYNITRNVWMTVIIHFVNNLLSVLAAAYAMGNADAAAEAGALLEDAADMTRAECVSGFLSYLLFAAIVIVPMIILLKNSCRKHEIGMFAAVEPDFVPEVSEAFAVEAIEGEGSLITDGVTAVKAPEETERGAGVLLKDPLLWVAIVFLLALNVVAGLIEFGVISAALD